MVLPWAEAGYDCICYDIQHPTTNPVQYFDSGGSITKAHADLMNVDTMGLHVKPTKIIFGFPPCTHVAVSGRAHFKKKGLKKLVEALTLFDRALDIIKLTNAPWMLENPVSTVSTYWRKPDYYFQPWEYGDNYTKKTCLWAGNGFVMPEGSIKEEPSDVDRRRIHYAGPSADRSDMRSITPMGFAYAVYEANK